MKDDEETMLEPYVDFFVEIEGALTAHPSKEEIARKCRRIILTGVKEDKHPSGPAILQRVLAQHRPSVRDSRPVRFVS